MRKIVALLLTLALAVPLMACGTGESTQVEETSAETTAEDTTQTIDLVQLHESNLESALVSVFSLKYVLVSENEGRFDASIIVGSQEKLSDFGIFVLEAKEAFENEFSAEERGSFNVTFYIDGTDDSIDFYSSNYSDGTVDGLSGKIIDYRSGNLTIHTITSVDELCEIFPATIAYIGKSNIDPDVLAIYEEVMDILNSDFSRSEDEILEEVAPNYGMTTAELKQFLTDTMLKIYGFSNNSAQTTDEQPNAIYPLNIDDAYLDCADNLPDIIYTTPASENGLDGNIYTFVGTIKEIITYSNDDYLYDAAFVETEKGTVIITNLYKAIYDSVVSSQGENATETVLSDEIADYIFPEIGETAQFVVIYSGYSSVYEMPAFYLGASSNFFELIGREDPANS